VGLNRNQMKNLKKFKSTFLLTIILFGCISNEDSTVLNSENSILGIWKLVEASISSGGPQYLVVIENGEEFKFSDDGTFTSTKYPACSTGSFSKSSKELILKYGCSTFTTGIENAEGNITYQVTFESDYITLNPTSVICIEGCSYIYKKIADKRNNN
jgi:hypothetical protein